MTKGWPRSRHVSNNPFEIALQAVQPDICCASYHLIRCSISRVFAPVKYHFSAFSFPVFIQLACNDRARARNTPYITLYIEKTMRNKIFFRLAKLFIKYIHEYTPRRNGGASDFSQFTIEIIFSSLIHRNKIIKLVAFFLILHLNSRMEFIPRFNF